MGCLGKQQDEPPGHPIPKLSLGYGFPGMTAYGVTAPLAGGHSLPHGIPPAHLRPSQHPEKGARGFCFHATSPAEANGPWFRCLRWGILEVSVLLNLTREMSSSETDMCTDRQRSAAPQSVLESPFYPSPTLVPPALPPSIPPVSKGRAYAPLP